MPVRNATMRSPFASGEDAKQPEGERAILAGKVSRSPFGITTPVSDTEAAVIAGKVARSPFVGQPVEKAPTHAPQRRVHTAVTDDPRRRETTK